MNSKGYEKKFLREGFVYYNNKEIYSEIIKVRNIINKLFNKNVSFYQKLKTNDFRKISARALKVFYKTVDLNKVFIHFSNVLAKILNCKNSFYVSSYVTLLIARPIKRNSNVIKEEESHGFHRETFYASPQSKKYMKHQTNFWIPIFDLKENQNMMHVPKSHKIREAKIKTVSLLSKEAKKFSVSHKLGYLYAPKKIVKGVNLDLAKRFKVPKNNFLIFNSNLIHGNGINLSKKIRFAFAVGLIREKYISKNIPLSFRTGKPQFVKII